jgi:hypothetical protein
MENSVDVGCLEPKSAGFTALIFSPLNTVSVSYRLLFLLCISNACTNCLIIGHTRPKADMNFRVPSATVRVRTSHSRRTGVLNIVTQEIQTLQFYKMRAIS